MPKKVDSATFSKIKTSPFPARLSIYPISQPANRPTWNVTLFLAERTTVSPLISQAFLNFPLILVGSPNLLHLSSMKSDTARRQFASDNYAGVCPEAWKALEEANGGHARSYGDDTYTARAADLIREVLETNCEVFFVFNGTAANSLALASLCQSYHSILCSEIAHVETDECGAPEFFSNGTKVLLLPTANGKVDPDGIEKVVKKRTDVHFPKPRAVSITQATEVGTVYTIDELNAIGLRAKALDLKLHMDGARFANAVASLDVPPKQITWQAGVDVLCFGGTKNGTHVGDAVVFFNPALAEEFAFRCKQAGHLASKMRFLAAPWVGMLQNGVWLKYAKHSNAMAQVLYDSLAQIPEVQILFPRQANSVFAQLPKPVVRAMWDRGWIFYNFIGWGGARLMCSWDTTEQDVRGFVADLKESVALAAR
jgi:threonine aldolase